MKSKFKVGDKVYYTGTVWKKELTGRVGTVMEMPSKYPTYGVDFGTPTEGGNPLWYFMPYSLGLIGESSSFAVAEASTSNKSCSCQLLELMKNGCTCGSIERYETCAKRLA